MATEATTGVHWEDQRFGITRARIEGIGELVVAYMRDGYSVQVFGRMLKDRFETQAEAQAMAVSATLEIVEAASARLKAG